MSGTSRSSSTPGTGVAYESLLASGPVYSVLRSDRRLVAVASLHAAIVAAAMALGFVLAVPFGGSVWRLGFAGMWVVILVLVVAGWAVWGLTVPLEGAVSAVVLAKTEGRETSLPEALELGWGRSDSLLAWWWRTTLSGTRRGIFDRYGVFGTTPDETRGLGWALSTSLVVPVIVAEDRPCPEAIERSRDLLSTTLNIRSGTHFRPFTLWATGAVGLGLLGVLSAAACIHTAHHDGTWAGTALVYLVIALACGLGSSACVAIRSAASTVLNTLTYGKALGLTMPGVDPAFLPGIAPAPSAGGATD